MIDISIIIVSWNASDFLEKCIQSILKESSNIQFEIIVVDNDSTDGSPEMLQNLFPSVNLIRNNENFGFAKANNIGIRKARGNYICLINSDVEVLPECFVRMLEYMKKNPEIGMLGPQILNPDETVQRTCRGWPTLWNLFCRAIALDTLFPKMKMFSCREMTYWAQDSIREIEVLSGCFLMVRRGAMDKVGLLDERFFIYAEDVDWCKRFWMAGWKVVYYPLAQSIHYGGASSENAPVRFYLEMQRANLCYWQKHHGGLAQKGYICIVAFHHVIRLIVAITQYFIRPSKRSQNLYKLKRNIFCIKWILCRNREDVGIHE